MARYEIASEDDHGIVDEVMVEYHEELANEEVKIRVMLAHANRSDKGDSKGTAISVRGYAALADSTVYNDKMRVLTGYDCQIMIDGDRWEDMSSGDRVALIDHQLMMFVIQRDKDDAPKYDLQARPKMGLRKYDFQGGWFHEVAKRHGKASLEVKQIGVILADDELKQLYLPFPELSGKPEAVS